MSDFSRSDLRDIERSLERLNQQLTAGPYSDSTGQHLERLTRQMEQVAESLKTSFGVSRASDNLEKIVSRLDDMKSLLRDIANRLDRR
ncbi:MAG: hypothetical protein JNJ73_15945 [Hyphomonadaceae bacterium]|nr:hypothetical protein [Hyphomonadaceae bacterium]